MKVIRASTLPYINDVDFSSIKENCVLIDDVEWRHEDDGWINALGDFVTMYANIKLRVYVYIVEPYLDQK